MEVSWSPPSSGATNITGYRIFYGNGKNLLLPSVNILGYVGLRTNKDSIGENVSIRSEANQLFSELVTVTVTVTMATVGRFFSKFILWQNYNSHFLMASL